MLRSYSIKEGETCALDNYKGADFMEKAFNIIYSDPILLPEI